jgi:biopolymer transport protein TolR
VRSLSRSNKTRIQPVMNVSPLVDVVLVLLIIFMVVIPAMTQGAPVDLPALFHVDKEGKSKVDPFTLSVTAAGDLYFEQNKLDPERMIDVLREANQKDPTRRLILRADRSAKYGAVRDLFKSCQEVGFPGVALKVNEANTNKGSKRSSAD